MSQFQGSIPLRLRNDDTISKHPHIEVVEVRLADAVRLLSKLGGEFATNHSYEVKVRSLKHETQPLCDVIMTFHNSEGCREAWRVLTGD